MNFGPRHYVPVLKIKRGEKKALEALAPAVAANITPLLEVVERKKDKSVNVAAHVDKAFKNLANSVVHYSRCFLDTREIASDGASAATEVFRRATVDGIVFTPVTGISRSEDVVVAALTYSSSGLALRLTRQEFEAGSLSRNLTSFLARHRLAPEQIDLIIDLGGVENLIPEGIRALTDAFLAEVPTHKQWRTFTLSSCAFPSSMGGVKRDSFKCVERAEWIAWRDGCQARRSALQRLPTFGDCAIQHPKGVEGFDPRTMQVSAAVRYTVPEAWLLIKGESNRTTPLKEQLPRLAERLVNGDLRKNFLGHDHCYGCASVKAAAEGTSGFGSLEAWRRIGTIHHITTVVRELDALPWP
jgi:hypothetical protein